MWEALPIWGTCNHNLNQKLVCVLCLDLSEMVMNCFRSLARREVDFLNRGMTGNFLDGLRTRILNLYLQYIRTPAFNPECKRFVR